MVEKVSALFLAASAAFFATPLSAQTAAAVSPVSFEVASIKPAAPLNAMQALRGQQRIGMKVDATRVDIANLSLADLVRIAFRVKPYHVMGPDWMKTKPIRHRRQAA